MYDLLIKGGTVVDGSGLARRRADVAVSGERVTSIGNLSGERGPPGCRCRRAHRRARASSTSTPITTRRSLGIRRVTPRSATVSPLSSPATAGSRSRHATATIGAYLAQMFARVEGMDLAAFEHVRLGVRELRRILPRAGRATLGVNFGCYVGHSSVRRYVHG